MKIYLVGGAVRDALLGLPVRDRDWVVVGATVQEMLDAGYTQVGRDFPVFLHPRSHEEYALARTERKSAPGYRGFVVHAAPDVTLAQDLARRDLSINAMAAEVLPAASGPLQLSSVVDPYGGQADLAGRVLRHTTDAFREDPVRILRLARFAARFADFRVAPGTQELLRTMVASGEADHLVAERVWQEFSRGLMETQPQRMLQVLADCGAWDRLLAGLPASGAHVEALQRAAAAGAPLEVRYAVLDRAAPGVLLQLRPPQACAELAELLARHYPALAESGHWDATTIVHWLQQCDAWRRPERLHALLQAAGFVAQDLPGNWSPAMRLARALVLTQAVPTETVAAACLASGGSGSEIGQAIARARVQAVASGLAIG